LLRVAPGVPLRAAPGVRLRGAPGARQLVAPGVLRRRPSPFAAAPTTHSVFTGWAQALRTQEEYIWSRAGGEAMSQVEWRIPMSEQTKVLVVDDEQSITDLVALALRYEQFEVAVAHTGRQALTAVRSFQPDLVVLDIMLPDFDGFEVARRMGTEWPTVPVLFLTARDATDDKIRGLTLGGDDYMTKPFSLEELVARIRAVLRRTRRATEEPQRLVFGDLEINEDTYEVCRAGKAVELTATEYKLLHYLMLNPRRVLSKAQILDRVWNYDFGGDANVVEIYISYLRKKLDPLGSPLIHTVRGFGYCLRETQD
jgi:two-component system OmpR family response regulator